VQDLQRVEVHGNGRKQLREKGEVSLAGVPGSSAEVSEDGRRGWWLI
jgi:hypothetical protein